MGRHQQINSGDGVTPMSGKRQAESNLDDLSDAEIYAAIRYLEPQVRMRNDDLAASVICFAVFIVLALVLIWLSCW